MRRRWMGRGMWGMVGGRRLRVLCGGFEGGFGVISIF